MRGLTAATGTYVLSPLRYHEAESPHVMREVAAEVERLVLLSSLAGGSAGQTPCGSQGRGRQPLAFAEPGCRACRLFTPSTSDPTDSARPRPG